MAFHDVQQQWPRYRRMIRVVFGAINNPITMASAAGVIGPLPEDPGDWDEWLDALQGLANLENAVHVTDAALRREQAFVVASNTLAAATSLPAPSAEQVNELVAQLKVVSAAIQQGQRFAAALKIASKLADSIDAQMKK